MSSIFTKIINREIPAYIIAENEKHIAFLDVNPLVLGHTLVVPKKEVDYIFDLEDQDLQELISFSKLVSKQLKNKIECIKIGMSVIGIEVPHTHIHLVPINTLDDINFSKPKLNLSFEQMSEIHKLLIS
jgi:histidine triad (HIT) family protein